MIGRAFTTILTALALGAVATYLLVPGPLELAAMGARQGQFGEARTAYENLLRERGNARSVVLPLADIYVGLGEDELARTLLRSYIDEHPEDSQVARRFAGLLRDTQHVEERMSILRGIADQTGELPVWRELEELYDIRGMPNERTEALLEIAQAGDATFAEFNDLARLLAAQDEHERALAVSLRALSNHPESITADSAQFHIALARAAERRDLAEDALNAWNANHTSPVEILGFSSTLENMGAPDLALHLIKESAPYEAGDTTLQLHALRLGAIAEDSTASFEQLLSWHERGDLPPEGYELIVETGTQIARVDEVFTALQGVQLASLPPDAQLALVELTDEFRNQTLLDAWRMEAGPEWRGVPPLTAARLAMALDDRTSAATLAQRSLDEATTDFEHANAARALASAGLTRQANETVSALAAKHSNGELAADALEPFVDAALLVNRGEIALEAARELAGRSDRVQGKVLYARALTAAGNPQEALNVLRTYDTRDPGVESAMLSALFAAGERERLQSLIYQRLSDPNIPRARRGDLVNILIDSAPLRAGANVIANGLVNDLQSNALRPGEQIARVRLLALVDPGLAVPYLRTLAGSSNPDDIMLHASLLMRAGQANQAYAVLARAAENARTADTRSGFVESLITLGGIEAALPLLAQLAETEGTDWRYAYEDALRQLGRRDALAEALTRHAGDAATPEEERRNLAFALLEIDRKDEAEAVFQTLAGGAGPASADAQSLAWLWGPRPAGEEIAWMTEQARNAQPADRTGWVSRILDAGAPQEAAALAEEMLADSNDAGLLDAAVRAYIVMDDRHGAERLLMPAATRIDNAETAEHFAQRAQEVGAVYAASLLFEKAARLDPARNEALGQASVIAFGNRELERARPMLEEYVGRGGRNPEAIFALAELDFEDGNLARARGGYEDAITASNLAPNDPTRLRLKALALLRLRRAPEAYDAFTRLIAMLPADLELRAEIGAALLDAGRLEEAARILRYSVENSTESLRR